jgi:hypothetical protein
VRYHFLRDNIKKGYIVKKYIDTERQLTDIFIKLLDASHFTSFGGGGDLVFAIPMAWFEGEIVLLSCI